MNKDEAFEASKSVFEKWEKEDVVEYLSAVLSEAVSNGINISVCETGFPYVECVDGNGNIQRVCGRKIPIREQVSLDFSRHDKEVKEEFEKEMVKNVPIPQEGEA